MPEETNDSIEQLFQEAEAGFQPTISTDVECKHCRKLTRRICPTCHGAYCEDCASTLDPAYCKLCLQPDDVKLIEKPLVDSEGVTHNGRELKPDPTSKYYQLRLEVPGKPPKATLATISEMSDYQLEGFIQHYHDLIKQSERKLDFQKIVLGAATVEIRDRKQAKLRAIRIAEQAAGKKWPLKSPLTVGVSGNKKAPSAAASSLDQMMKAMEQIMRNRQEKAAMERLEAIMASKKDKA